MIERSSYLTGLAGALRRHDSATDTHCQHVARVAQHFLRARRYEDDFRGEVCLAARLHDLGKLCIPAATLQARRALTPEEQKAMQLHPVYGGTMLAAYPGMERVALAIRCHHEAWNGLGYPYARRGEEIPFMAQIVSICDTFVAMTEDRPYRKAFAPDVALQEIEGRAGAQFSRELVAAFCSALRGV